MNQEEYIYKYKSVDGERLVFPGIGTTDEDGYITSNQKIESPRLELVENREAKKEDESPVDTNSQAHVNGDAPQEQQPTQTPDQPQATVEMPAQTIPVTVQGDLPTQNNEGQL